MSTVQASLRRLPPPLPRMPIVKKFESVADFRQRILARKHKEKCIFWGILVGLGGVICLFFFICMSRGSISSNPENTQNKIAVLEAQRDKTESPSEYDRLTAEINRLKEKGSLSSQICFNKSFIVSTKNSKFEVTFTDIGIDPYDTPSTIKKYKINLYFTYKNLGPREGDIYFAKMSHDCGRNTYLTPGELKTEKGHIFGTWQYSGDPYDKRNDVIAAYEVEKTGKTFIFSFVPYGSVPAEISFGGDTFGRLIIPKDKQEKIRKEAQGFSQEGVLAGRN